MNKKQIAQRIALDIERKYRLSEQLGDRVHYLYQHAYRKTLHVDDVSAIPFLEGIVGVEYYQTRARLRAKEGDSVLIACAFDPFYEHYCRESLGLGQVAWHQVEVDLARGNAANVCRQATSPRMLSRLSAELATTELTIHPYMGHEDVWTLADELSRYIEKVNVLAPPPAVTWFANDKESLTELARTCMAADIAAGMRAIPTETADEVVDIADKLKEFAEIYPTVALKMKRCASAMGNRVFHSSQLLASSQAQREEWVRDFLSDKEAQPNETVLICAWLDNRLSPSTQLWIPPLGQGEPYCEGVYEQLLEGDERVFLGSLPARSEVISQALRDSLVTGSLAMASVLQYLGYVGRCSFDFIVDNDIAYVVECNGRWGGTSSPMTLVDRLFSKRPHYRAKDVISDDLRGLKLHQLLAKVGDELYDVSSGNGHYIIYNVGGLESFGKFDAVAIGQTFEQAEKRLNHDLYTLLKA